MFQGTCHRRRELVLEPDTQPPHTCHQGVRRSTTTHTMATDPEPGPSLP